MLRAGVPLVWFDRRSHHLVTFDEAVVDTSWAGALVGYLKDGRARSLEVRKVNGDSIAANGPWAAALLEAGFADGYKGLTLRA